MLDVLDSGLAWEKEVVGKVLAGRVTVAPGDGELTDRRFDCAGTLDRLRAEPVGRFIYQAALSPPRRFYAAYGLPESLVHFGDCHPDLIEIREGSDGRLLRVIDIKRARRCNSFTAFRYCSTRWFWTPSSRKPGSRTPGLIWRRAESGSAMRRNRSRST
jgi:hypothetical protein